MQDYFDDLLVWAIILAVIVPLAIIFFKNKRVFLFILGILLLIGGIPIAIMSELSINGCCGAQSSGSDGTGYLIGAVISIIGIVLLFISKNRR